MSTRYQLKSAIREIHGKKHRTGYACTDHSASTPLYALHFGLDEIDQALPCKGLATGCLHQWSLTDAMTCKEKHRWHAPLFLLSALLGKTFGSLPYVKNPISQGKSIVVWIGKRCWPTPQLLEQNISWQSEVVSGGEISWPWKAQAVFINPQSKSDRLWATIQALKNPAVYAVISDCSGFDLNAMRRMQLAAEFGNSLGLVVRPPWEAQLPSAAHTKWELSPVPSTDKSLCWKLNLLVAKGVAMPHQLSKQLAEKLSKTEKPPLSLNAVNNAINDTINNTANNTIKLNNSGLFVSDISVSNLAVSGLSVCSSHEKQNELEENSNPPPEKLTLRNVSSVQNNSTRHWLIKWNEELNYGKGALCITSQSTDQRATKLGDGESNSIPEQQTVRAS